MEHSAPDVDAWHKDHLTPFHAASHVEGATLYKYCSSMVQMSMRGITGALATEPHQLPIQNNPTGAWLGCRCTRYYKGRSAPLHLGVRRRKPQGRADTARAWRKSSRASRGERQS